jgi:hypothetical protein
MICFLAMCREHFNPNDKFGCKGFSSFIGILKKKKRTPRGAPKRAKVLKQS